MKLFTLFVVERLLPLYLILVIVAVVGSVVNYLVGMFSADTEEDIDTEIIGLKTRLFVIVVWPFLLPSRRGRALLYQSFNNIL